MNTVKKLIIDGGCHAWCRFIAVIITVMGVKRFAGSLLLDWQEMRGWEAYWIAQALVDGKGYSFPSTNRWLFDILDDGAFHATAWVDPLYTFCLAGLIWLFGDYHQLAAGVFNLLLLLAVFGLTYRLGERLVSGLAGVIAVLLLSLVPFSFSALQMNNTMLAACFILLVTLCLIRFLEEPGYVRAVILGTALGLTVLACPGAQLFIPIVVISIIFWGWKNITDAVPQALLVLVMATLVILPWAGRNYSVFDEIVPVRNGAGQIAFIGVVATAGTVEPDRLASNIKPEWSAETPRSAIFQALKREERTALERYQAAYVKELGPPEYAGMNEAQRDKWLLKETKGFLVDNPILSMKLAVAKLETFIRSMGLTGTIAFFLAIAAGLIAIKNPAVVTLVLWVGSYTGPFLLIISYFSRYRAPIEPLVAVLAAFTLCWVFKRVFVSLTLINKYKVTTQT